MLGVCQGGVSSSRGLSSCCDFSHRSCVHLCPRYALDLEDVTNTTKIMTKTHRTGTKRYWERSLTWPNHFGKQRFGAVFGGLQW